MQVIVFQNEVGGVSVVWPTPEFSGDLADHAAEVVPSGLPWRLMEASSLPSRGVRNLWRWTETGPLAVAEEP